MPDNYRRDQLQRVLDAGPFDEETCFFRLNVVGPDRSKFLNITPDELVAIRDLLYAADNPITTT